LNNGQTANGGSINSFRRIIFKEFKRLGKKNISNQISKKKKHIQALSSMELADQLAKRAVYNDDYNGTQCKMNRKN